MRKFCTYTCLTLAGLMLFVGVIMALVFTPHFTGTQSLWKWVVIGVMCGVALVLYGIGAACAGFKGMLGLAAQLLLGSVVFSLFTLLTMVCMVYAIEQDPAHPALRQLGGMSKLFNDYTGGGIFIALQALLGYGALRLSQRKLVV